MSRLAIVAGGWHFPYHFYKACGALDVPAGWQVDKFVIAHRSPDLPIVREEKIDAIPDSIDPMVVLDLQFYSRTVRGPELPALGWLYSEEPNLAGDWVFLNQWAEKNRWQDYDVVWITHDDNYIRRDDVLLDVIGGVAGNDWLILANGKYPSAPAGYCRGSCEFVKRELLQALGGKIDLGELANQRVGLTDSPVGIEALSAWNQHNEPLRRWIIEQKLLDKIAYLSPHYRISKWVIEGERGFLHHRGGAPWSFDAGVRELA